MNEENDIVQQDERNLIDQILKDNVVYYLYEINQFCIYRNGYFDNSKKAQQEIRELINKYSKEYKVYSTKTEKLAPFTISISKRNNTLEILKAEVGKSLIEFDNPEDKFISVLNGIMYFREYEKIICDQVDKDGNKFAGSGKDVKTEKCFGEFFSHSDGRFGNSEDKPKSFVQLPVNYDPEAKCLLIDQFLTETIGFERVPLIYKALAYLLMPHVKYQKAFMFYGQEATGKTTLLTLITRFLCGANAFVKARRISELSLEDLSQNFRMVELQGKMGNIVDDIDKNVISRFKQFNTIVTNEMLSGNIKNVQGDAHWWNRNKLIYTCNILPTINKRATNAFWRRWILVDCFHQVPKAEQNSNLISELTNPKELSGLLNKVIEYYNILENEGNFGLEWEDIEHIKSIWELDKNPVALFIEQNCVVSANDEVDQDLFFQELNKFRLDKKVKEVSKATCTRALIRFLGKDNRDDIKRKLTTGKYNYMGFRFNNEFAKSLKVIDVERLNYGDMLEYTEEIEVEKE